MIAEAYFAFFLIMAAKEEPHVVKMDKAYETREACQAELDKAFQGAKAHFAQQRQIVVAAACHTEAEFTKAQEPKPITYDIDF